MHVYNSLCSDSSFSFALKFKSLERIKVRFRNTHSYGIVSHETKVIGFVSVAAVGIHK